MQVAEYFKQLPLFADLSIEEIMDVLRMAKVVRFAPGEHLCRRDEQADSLFVVEQGQAAVRIADPSQKRAMPLEVALIGPGEMIGELALVDGQPRSADVVAVTELKGYQLARSDFDSMRAQLHPAAYKMLRRIAITVSDRLRDINDEISKEIARGDGPRPKRKITTPGRVSEDPGRVSRAQERITKQTLGGVRVSAPPDEEEPLEPDSEPAPRPRRKKKRRAVARPSRELDARPQEAQPGAEGGGGFWKTIKKRVRGGAME